VLVRIFGESDGLLDRGVENTLFGELSTHGISPKLYGCFEWGRLEEFIPDHFPLKDGADMMRHDMIRVIGSTLRRLHSIELSDSIRGASNASLFDVLQKWLQLVRRECIKAQSGAPCASDEVFLATLSNSVEFVLSTWQSKVSTDPRIQSSGTCQALLSRSLCHNDLLAGNLMYSPGSHSLRLIDFEYAGMNYQVADISNVLTAVSESFLLAGEAQDVVKNFPSAEEQIMLVETCTGMSVTPDERDTLLSLVQFFCMADELRWVIWGVIQSTRSTIEFDYSAYYKSRYAAFLDYKRMWENIS
jgi:thiamine kinase-like enzyme